MKNEIRKVDHESFPWIGRVLSTQINKLKLIQHGCPDSVVNITPCYFAGRRGFESS